LLLVHLVDTFSGCGSVFSVARAAFRPRAMGNGQWAVGRGAGQWWRVQCRVFNLIGIWKYGN
jgi:hypothetical protein